MKKKTVYLLTIKELDENKNLLYSEQEIYSSLNKVLNRVSVLSFHTISYLKEYIQFKYCNYLNFDNFEYKIELMQLN